MISLRFDQLADITHGKLLTAEQAGRRFTGVSIDSRTIRPEHLFFAIKGENNDGHQFVDQAIAAGAAGLVLQTGYLTDTIQPNHVAVVEVPDSHAAMLQLAAAYMETVDARRVGISGSNGKTTTKEFAFQLLRTVVDKVYRSPGNYNNLFGIPLALMAMPVDTDVAVLEMGISVPGEMARLASLVQPHLMVITNVGATHLEYLGSVENVAREKLSALAHAQPDAPLIVNADDPVLMAEAARVSPSVTTFGMKAEATFSPDQVEPDGRGMTSVTIEGHRFRLPLFGEYQVSNLLAAYTAARVLGYSFEQVDTAAIKLTSGDMRGEMIEAGGVTFISDCYNANPESIRAGLISFDGLPGDGRRVIILGDMLELGEASARYHAEIGEQLDRHPFDLLVTVGPLSVGILNAARAAGIADESLIHFDNAAACADKMIKILRPGDRVYVKGSRGIGLEAILTRFTDEGGPA